MQGQCNGSVTVRQPAPVRPLDPGRNNSKNSGLKPGHYKRLYLGAARAKGWGELGAKCGGSVLVRFDEQLRRLYLVPALCKQFGCDLCGPMRASWLKRNIKRCVPEYQLNSFLTLTLRSTSRTPEESFQQIGTYWNRFKTAVVYQQKKKYGPGWSLQYIWTVEPTKASIAHLHVLCNLRESPAVLAAYWQRATGDSYVLDLEPVSTARAGDYLAKYCTQKAMLKSEPGHEYLHHKRLFGKSQDIAFDDFITPSQATGWSRLPVPYWKAYGELATRSPIVKARHTGAPSSVFESAGVKFDLPLEMWQTRDAADAVALEAFAADLVRFAQESEVL